MIESLSGQGLFSQSSGKNSKKVKRDVLDFMVVESLTYSTISEAQIIY